MSAATITLADLVTAYGNYYVKGSQNEARLYTLMRQSSETPLFATKIMTEDTRYQGSLSTFSDVIQPFQKDFTPVGSLTFVPREIPLYNIKMDVKLFPDELKATWLGFLASLESEQARTEWPLIRWLMEKHLIPTKEDNMELQVYYKGVYSAPVAETAGAVATSMNGLRKILRDGVSAGRVKDLAFGNFTTANVREKIEAMVDSLPAVYDRTPSTIYLEPYWYTAYLRDKRGEFGANVDYNAAKTTIDFKPNMKIAKLPSMAGTNDCFITPDFNYVHIRRIGGQAPVQIQAYERMVKLLTDWWEGLGFLVEELVYFHDAAETSGT